MATKQAIDFVELINQASESDLKQINERIKALKHELAILRKARSVLAVKFKAANSAEKKGPPNPIAERAYDLISSQGPLAVYDLAQRLEVKPQSVGAALSKSGWFLRNADGEWEIAKTA